jgi:hypothetical protein
VRTVRPLSNTILRTFSINGGIVFFDTIILSEFNHVEAVVIWLKEDASPSNNTVINQKLNNNKGKRYRCNLRNTGMDFTRQTVN